MKVPRLMALLVAFGTLLGPQLGFAKFSSLQRELPQRETPPALCQNFDLAEIKPMGVITSFSSLGHVLLVAREARVFMDVDGLRIATKQNFMSKKSELSCLSRPQHKISEVLPSSFSIIVPTLLDLTENKSVGHIAWQFNIFTDSKRVGIWHQVSRLHSRLLKISDLEMRSDRQVSLSQINNNQYELLLKEKNRVVVVVFDSIHGQQFDGTH